jgi:hypothetical protein
MGQVGVLKKVLAHLSVPVPESELVEVVPRYAFVLSIIRIFVPSLISFAVIDRRRYRIPKLLHLLLSSGGQT